MKLLTVVRVVVPVVLVGLLAAPTCAGKQLSGGLGDAVRNVDRSTRNAGDAAQKSKEIAAVGKEAQAVGQEVARCEKVRAQEIAFEEERALGEAAALRMARANGGFLYSGDTAEVTEYLNLVGRILAERSERPALTWTFFIVDSDQVNAFAVPGGLVMVTKGLMKKVENEAQLAGVLAHEIAHVTGRHALNRYREFKETSCKAGLVGKTATAATSAFSAAVKSDVGFVDLAKSPDALRDASADAAKRLSSEKFDPTAEKQADYDAVGLLIAAGYDPNEYVTFLEKLPDEFQSKTHPAKKDRIASVRAGISALKSDPIRGPLHPFAQAQGFKSPPLDPAITGLGK